MTPQAVESRRTALVIPIIPRCSAVAPSRVATLVGGFSQRDTDKWVSSQSCYSEKWRKAKALSLPGSARSCEPRANYRSQYD